MHQKLVPDTFLILVNSPKHSLHARNYFKNKIFGWGLSKRLTSLNPVPFNGRSYQAWNLWPVIFRLQNKFRKIPLLVIFYLAKFDYVIQSSFSVITKTTSANLSTPIHDIINYSTSICSSTKSGREKTTKVFKESFLKKKKELFRWNKKNILHSF